MTRVAERGGEILRRLPRSGPLRGAEVGVYDARLSRWLLAEEPRLHLFMVDRWGLATEGYAASGSEMAKHTAPEWAAVYAQATGAVEEFGPRAVMLRGESVDVAARLSVGILDFAFIDADHTMRAVQHDIAAWLPRIRSGGWICGHDWDHPEDHTEGKRRRWGVADAVRSFFTEDRIELGDNRTWFVQC